MEQQRSFSNLLTFTPVPSAGATSTPSPSVSFFKVPEPTSASEEKAPSHFVMPHHDPIFFADPTLGHDIDDFFGIKIGSENSANYGMGTQHPFNYDASYNCSESLIARYDPTADDLETFKSYEERKERAAVQEDSSEKAASERALLEAEDDRAGIISQPILVQTRSFVKRGGRGKKR